jgi:hypothetical protein
MEQLRALVDFSAGDLDLDSNQSILDIIGKLRKLDRAIDSLENVRYDVARRMVSCGGQWYTAARFYAEVDPLRRDTLVLLRGVRDGNPRRRKWWRNNPHLHKGEGGTDGAV